MYPSEARCEQGGIAEGMWELTIYLCTFYEVQNDSKIECLFEISKHLPKGCVSQELN